ncbi:hypothetical protein [Marinifilum caeruleilacunae]|uniref:Uncharacterized protein n=1 Tax=Marinifilum caeruleilacunae TaxID=2499076 RepID=A0ABX1WU51_9BACT|nr:hypothetical protein [Marinifilum caeruleilacunae]NOU59639.1 hypothetical protein [Marinifilum caeruleilacunae]
MKSVLNKNIIVILIAFAAIACDKESDKELNDDKGFCSYLNIEEISQTIPIVNEFLSELPDSITKEQTFESLEAWLNSFSCDVNAKILYGEDLIWGEEQMSGVSISVKDNDIMRELELDFSIIDNAITYTQIAGYTYLKQDAIHVKTQYAEIDKVFEFINSLDFDIKEIQGGTYLSSMAADSDTLEYIIDNLKSKPYTTDSWVTGHLNWYNANIVIFLRLYDMKNNDYQADWKEAMNEYKLENYSSGTKHIIVFFIPEGTGEEWETNFTEYEFVDWAELSYTNYTIR